MKNLILIGFMGSGKTSVGIKLSYACRVPFLDMDKEIEKEQGRTVSAIFAQMGEEAFRQMETDYLRRFFREGGKHILSTGGGTPLREENRALLKKAGKVVYLRVQPETVYARLKKDTTRPLLAGEDPKGKISGLLAERRELYEACADCIVDVDGKTLEAIVEEIRSKTGEFM